jgi:hypothetical protein
MRDWTTRGPLLLVLLVSVLLRVELVRHGGQSYWPDEIGYDDAKEMLASLAAGDHARAFAQIDRYGPMLFKVVALLPAAIERGVGGDLLVPGLFFAMFSVFNIVLIGRLAKGLGASDFEALLASTLLAMSSALFYFARHLLPYDLAMTFALVAVHLGVRSGSSLGDCFASGLIAACTFFAYNGYWAVVAAVPVLNAVAWPRPWRDAVRRALLSGAGVCTVMGSVIGLSASLGGHLIESYRTFGGQVSQGAFQEGWRLPFEYLWHAEQGLLIVWLASLGWCLVTLSRSSASPRVRVGLTGLLVVYVALATSSTLLHAFVVYGRLARQLVPFLCLLAAYALARARTSHSAVARALVPAVVVVLLAQSAVNFQQPLKQTFPDELERQYGPSHSSDLIWVNVEHIYPEPRKVALPDQFVLVHQALHPLQFRPYQYEGYTPAQRHLLRSTDIRMRILARLPTPP